MTLLSRSVAALAFVVVTALLFVAVPVIGSYRKAQSAGVAVTQQRTLNFTAPLTATDDSANSRTNVTCSTCVVVTPTPQPTATPQPTPTPGAFLTSVGTTRIVGTTQTSAAAAPLNTLLTGTATCSGSLLVSGGGALITTDDPEGIVVLQSSYPSSTTVWTATAISVTNIALTKVFTVTPYVDCVKP